MDKIYKLMFYGCLIVIEFLATTTQEIKPLEHSWDKANHFIAFMTLYVLLTLAYKKLSIKAKVLILLAFGVQIEIVQSFIPGREVSGFDVFADSIGIGIGIGAYLLYKKRLNNEK
ncbi:VanZ family protein [Sulfurimonas sp.]